MQQDNYPKHTTVQKKCKVFLSWPLESFSALKTFGGS